MSDERDERNLNSLVSAYRELSSGTGDYMGMKMSAEKWNALTAKQRLTKISRSDRSLRNLPNCYLLIVDEASK